MSADRGLPSWTDHVKEGDWDACVILMRHEEKEAVRSAKEHERQLTGDGRARALTIGKELKDVSRRNTFFISSPVQRCFDTASLIAEGMGLEPEVRKDDGLLTIVYNTGVDWTNDANGYGEYVNGKVRDGYDHPMVGTRKYLDILLPMLSNDGDLTVCVSHDLAIAIFNAMVTKRFRSGNWMGYAEGVLIVRSGDAIDVIWEGVRYPLFDSLDDDSPVDTSP